MKADSNKNLKSENDLFMKEDDFAQETAIYLEISSEEFKHANDLILAEVELKKTVNQFFWEENDAFNYQ